jgi:cytochrome P450
MANDARLIPSTPEAFDPYSDEVMTDPFPAYARLRDHDRAHFNPDYNCFFLSRFEDVYNACRDRAFSHRFGTTPDVLLLGHPVPARALSSLVPPEHTTLRATLNPEFLPSAAREMEERTRLVVREWLDNAAADGGLDVQLDYAGRLAVHVTLEIAGLPLSDTDWIFTKVREAFDRKPNVRGQSDVARAAVMELNEYATRMIDERRKNPAERGVLQKLINYRYEGNPMTQEELVANLFLLIIGGSETMPKVFAGLVDRLWRNPDQRAAVAADSALVQDAVWEALRTEMPTTMLGATAEQDTTICGGVPIKAGQKIMCLWAAANRDEREFPDPDTFNVLRRAPRIVSFNPGKHICLGMHVAQMEGRVLLQELLARAPNYDVLENQAVRVRSEMFRGYSSLPIKFN